MSRPAHLFSRAGVIGLASLSMVAMSAAVLAPNATSSTPIRTTTDPTPAKIATNWLSGELQGGLIMTPSGPDYGLTLDVAIALDQVGSRSSVAAINAAFKPRLADYIGSGSEVFAGASAKAAVFAGLARENPTSYGGFNLITRLEERVEDSPAPTPSPSPNPTVSPSPSPSPSPTVTPTPSPDPIPTATPGRLSDKSPHGDFANVVGQAYAVRALSLSESKETANALAFLLRQQCASGAFRLNFAKPDDPVQNCVDGAPASTADPDATALAVLNLHASHETGPAVADSLARAGAWLAAQQRPNGAFRGVGPTRKANTNSTSLAGYALAVLGNRTAASKAAVWVRKRQPVDKFRCRTALAKELGAVAYRQVAVGDARTGGISASARDEWRRATAQAALVLQYAPASPDRLDITTVRRQARSGDKVRYWIHGLAPGERACVQIKGDFKRVIGRANGLQIVRGLRMPVGNHGRWAVVKTAAGKDAKWIRVRN